MLLSFYHLIYVQSRVSPMFSTSLIVLLYVFNPVKIWDMPVHRKAVNVPEIRIHSSVYMLTRNNKIAQCFENWL